MSFYEKLIFATYDKIGGGGLRATVCCFYFDDTNVRNFKGGLRSIVCCFRSFAKNMPLPGEVSAQLYVVFILMIQM